LVVDSGDIAPNGAGVVSGNGYVAIRVQFTTAGTRKLEGAIKKAGRILAVTLDGEIISMTVTNGEQKPEKKRKQPGDSAAPDVPQLDIFGGFSTLDEANDLAAILNAGPLPVPLKVVNTRVITE
jgi:preprotein translocase subunit SecD